MGHWIPLGRAAVLAGLVAGLVTGPLHAQTLDFDEICASPPCAAGDAYSASWSITIAPPATPIVAAGTNGITGSRRGHYLSVEAPPYAVTFTLPRTATFIALDVARSSLSNASSLVRLELLYNGVAVPGDWNDVALDSVGAWQTLTASLPSGFNGFRLTTSGGSNRTFGLDNVRIAGNCAGFGDVLPGSASCNAVEWLYNRSITLGCALGQYCPSNNVTREQMALFMQRLGMALKPTLLYGYNQVTTDPNAVSNPTSICQVTHVPAWASSANVIATMIAYDPPGPGIYQLFLSYSPDAGTTWLGFPGFINTFASASPGTAGSTTAFTTDVPLEAGRTYVFEASVRRDLGTPGPLSMFCYLRVNIGNGSSAAAPFDPIEPPRVPHAGR